MREALQFLESKLQEASASFGDAEVLRLAEETRDERLFQAEQERFSQSLAAELLARREEAALRVLLIDLGGSPAVAPALLTRLLPTFRKLAHLRLAYARLDPNPAGHRALQRSLAPLSSLLSRYGFSTLFSCVEPTLANLGHSTWQLLRQKFDLIVSLLPGGRFHAFGNDPGEDGQNQVIESFLRPSDLVLATFLSPSGLADALRRLRAVKEAGALFEEVRLQYKTRLASGEFLFEEEESFPLDAPDFPQEAVSRFGPPLLEKDSTCLLVGVAHRQGPTHLLARIFSEEYLRRALFSGFRFTEPTLVGEGWITTLRHVH